MKKIYYLCFLLILLCAISCEKPLIKTGNIYGVVKDATTGEPIANADVFLLQNEIGDGDIWSGGGPSEQIDFTTSDANGYFSFLFDYDKNYRYLCGAEKVLYFDLDQEFAVDEDATDGNNVEVLLNPVSWLRIRCVNTSPFDSNDEITLSLILDGGNPEFIGADIDTTLCCFLVNGNLENRIVWYVNKAGMDSSYFQNIYCPSFDTTYFEILY